MSRQTEIQELITNYHRRLQKLKEKEATFGINTPPEVLIEIEDIEAKVEQLKKDLKVLELKLPLDISGGIPEKVQIDTFKEEKDSPIEVLVAKIGLSGTIITAILGLVGIGITAYFGYLGLQIQIKAPIEATQTAEAKSTLLAFSVTPTTLAVAVPSTDTSTPEPPQTPSPAPLDTSTTEPTRTPTTPSNTPTPTSTLAPVCPSPHYFQDVWKIHPKLGCSINASTSDFTFQTYEKGIMAWQKSPAPPMVYAFYNNGNWERQTDPGGPPTPSCPAAEQTNGLGPIFGFGTLWCEPWNWKDGLGLPTDREIDAKNNQIQNFENGTILTIGEAGGFILYSDGQWERF
jgi:hypothetical protein